MEANSIRKRQNELLQQIAKLAEFKAGNIVMLDDIDPTVTISSGQSGVEHLFVNKECPKELDNRPISYDLTTLRKERCIDFTWIHSTDKIKQLKIKKHKFISDW